MDREAAKRTMLRILVAIAASLAATSFVFGFFPGIEVYRDGVFVETRAVVERWNWFLGILVMLLAPGAVVWRHPRLGYALLWSLWTIAMTVLVLVATFELGEWGVRTAALWPRTVFGFLMFALVFLLIAIVPIACGVYWWVARDRVVPRLPVARVISR